MLNALSIDLEDYYHAESLKPSIQPEHWDGYRRRVRENTERILALLKNYSVQATFFVLGWVAEREPDLIQEIHSQGHEIACHGYSHKMITKQLPEEFRADLRKARGLIEPLIGQKLLGYRAPTFSIVKSTLWALDVLIEEGFVYDSSIFPIHHDRYGIPGAERLPHQIKRDAGSIYEFPMSTLRIIGLNLPAGGGGYLRILPYAYTQWAVGRLNRQQQPAMVYLHPWEIDLHQPRQALPLITSFRHYYNLKHMEVKFKHLLRDFEFAPVAKVMGLLG